MENEKNIIEDEFDIQDTFNTDSLDILVEDGEVENVCEEN